MGALRFNHMELTLAPGQLTAWRQDLTTFYHEVFGFSAVELDLFGQPALALQTDPEGSQFLLLVEQGRYLEPVGYDHLGFLVDSFQAVDELRSACQAWQQKDSRVEIIVYDDLVLEATTTRAFYVRYGLPIWFDVQHIAYHAGHEPRRQWRFETVNETAP